jgi:hypothetical protein
MDRLHCCASGRRLPRNRFIGLSILAARLIAIAALSAGPAMSDDTAAPATSAPEPAPPVSTPPELRQAIERSLSLLETASAKSADQRKCFTCHSQAHPVIVLSEAQRRGFTVDADNLTRQVRHTAKHLDRGRSDYVEGRGQGGKADTAGYALWALSAGEHQAPATIDPVITWLLQQQQPEGHWKRSSDRPPSEASHFTTTYLALRAIGEFCSEHQQAELVKRYESARQWLAENRATDTEDRVFRLLTLAIVDAPESLVSDAANELLESQSSDGGWSQRELMNSDAYATGTALYALAQTRYLNVEDEVYLRGVRYLLETQQDDGSWHVTSRSKPFQAYYETGFPHGPDQFISTSATAWAAYALLLASSADE